MDDLTSKDYSDLFCAELNRGRISINSQRFKMQSIFDKASNIVLQTHNFYSSTTIINKTDIKDKDNESPVKYNFNRSTVSNLIKIVENYKKLVNLQKLNYNNSIKGQGSNNSNEQISTQSEEFEIFKSNITNTNEYLKTSIRRLEFLLEKNNAMKDYLDILTNNESSSSSGDDDDENDSLH